MNQAVLDKLLSVSLSSEASDVHFQVGFPPIFRINGELREVKAPILTPDDTLSVARILLRNSKQEKQLENLSEIDTSYGIVNVGRFRVNIFRQRGSYGIVVRTIPSTIKNFEELNLPIILEHISLASRGLVLVTGATGMGKSTTLACMINHINNNVKSNIITIEDPIEFLFRHNKSLVVQREIGTDTDDFRSAMKAALRQDPDVIMVGEMRDVETIDSVLKAAETGHLVLSTLHTTDAYNSINRFIGMFPPEEQFNARQRLAETLRAIVSLRLLLKADNTGRIPAVEILITTPDIQLLIRDPNKTSSINEVISKNRDQYGMQTFDQHLLDLHRDDLISKETALSAATKPEAFKRALTYE